MRVVSSYGYECDMCVLYLVVQYLSWQTCDVAFCWKIYPSTATPSFSTARALVLHKSMKTDCLQLLALYILQPALPVLHAPMLHVDVLSVNHTIDVRDGGMIAVTEPNVA